MEQIMNYKGPWWILALIVFALALIILLGIAVPPVEASVFVYGSVPNYSAVILPNDSYVHQGENISQGNYYDLRGIYGFSGELAHWNNDNHVGQGEPDQIITLSGRDETFIDPVIFPVGRYWQWDGNYCASGSDYCSTGFGHGNAYVFYVNPQQISLQERVIVQTSNITISQNGSTIEIPVTYTMVQTYYGTPEPTETPSSMGTILIPTTEPTQAVDPQSVNPDVQDKNGISIPGGVTGATVITAKGPVPVAVPIVAVIGIFVLMRRKE